MPAALPNASGQHSHEETNKGKGSFYLTTTIFD